MFKKVISITVSVWLMITSIAALCACGLFDSHTEVVDAAVEATCTESGLTEGRHCLECGVIIIAQEIVPPKGHKFGAWQTENDRRFRECSVCRYKEIRDDNDKTGENGVGGENGRADGSKCFDGAAGHTGDLQ